MTAFIPAGDASILVELGDTIDPLVNARALALADAVRALSAGEGAFGPPVPAYASVLVPYDPLRLSPDEASARLADLVGSLPAPGEDGGTGEGVSDGELVEVPVRYGGVDGPDLEPVAALHDLTAAEVVELHASMTYRVYFLGFAPGFAYLGRVPPVIATPRLDTPRTRVPAGSVGIAGEQTAIYPFATPGGWRLLGRTDAVLWDVRRNPPALLAPGMRVRFVPIDRAG